MTKKAIVPDIFDHHSFLKSLTHRPGVYQMYNASNEILYVGKAKNLKNRLSSYFVKSNLSIKTAALVRKIAHIYVTVTPSEREALILEQNLIKAERPPYNILLRDDKSYPYIFLSTDEPFPRLALHRGAKKRTGRYFGPFPSAGAVRESLTLLQKIFNVRQCEDSVFRNRSRPCLQYQIQRCSGPCVDLITEDNYVEDVRRTEMFLEGKNDSLQEELAAAMEAAAEKLEYEEAARYRDKIAVLRQVQEQRVVDVGKGSVDVIACAVDTSGVCVHTLFIRHGRILGSKTYYLQDKLGVPADEVLSAFLPQLYLGGRSADVPAEVVLSEHIADADIIAALFESELGKKVVLSTRVIGHRAKWLKLARETARQNLKSKVASQQSMHKRYEHLQEILSLEQLPERLECFDISHSSGEKTVASCVVFDQNGPVKSDYRRFNIEGVQAGDDYGAMEQALTRRYTRVQKEEGRLPDILLVDGGKGQFNKAEQVLADLGMADVLIVGVAKGTTRKPGFETLVLESRTTKVLGSDSHALHLIQQIRDEAHRFAVTGHKNRRDKARRVSSLEAIPGIGPKRRRELLRYFGGLQEIMRAGVDDLAQVPSMSKKMAQEVYSALHSE